MRPEHRLQAPVEQFVPGQEIAMGKMARRRKWPREKGGGGHSLAGQGMSA